MNGFGRKKWPFLCAQQKYSWIWVLKDSVYTVIHSTPAGAPASLQHPDHSDREGEPGAGGEGGEGETTEEERA